MWSRQRNEPRKFSRDLPLALACFAVSFLLVVFCLAVPPSPDIGDIRIIFLCIVSPLIGAIAGLGIGILIERKLLCCLLGFHGPATLLGGFILYLWLSGLVQ